MSTRKCALCAQSELATASQAFRVSGKSIPQDAEPNIKKLSGKDVCHSCSELLKTARIRTYNVQGHLDRQAREATSTIAEILASKIADRGIIVSK